MLIHRLSTSILATVLSLGLSVNVGATVTASTSSAYGEFVDLTVTSYLGVAANVTSGPLPAVSGSAPAPYNLTNSALSASVLPFLSTGLLTVNASSNVDSSPGTRNTNADATVNNLSVLMSSFGIDLTATTVQSTAAVSGDYGAFNAAGTTTIEGLTLNGVASLLLTPAPNTILLSLPGLRIMLNEQITSGGLPGSFGIGVNAIHVEFDHFLAPNLSLVNGDILIAHSQASMGLIPEPETYALMLAGLAVMGAIVRRRSVTKNV
jgi:hypothetical protein